MSDKKQALKTFLLGGLLPVIIFTVVEEYFGTLWGLAAGLAFGVGEILHEWIRHKHVETMTWVGNGVLLVLGGISLFTREGIWFKLQPAILEAVTGVMLITSVAMGNPFLTMMAKKQKMLEKFPQHMAPVFEKVMKSLTVRLSVFFFAHAALAVYAALYWSTRAWALLKGVGFTVSMILYLFLEVFWMRGRMRRAHETAVPFDPNAVR